MKELQFTKDVTNILKEISDISTSSVIIVSKADKAASILIVGNTLYVEEALREAIKASRKFACMVHNACLDYDINNMSPN